MSAAAPSPRVMASNGSSSPRPTAPSSASPASGGPSQHVYSGGALSGLEASIRSDVTFVFGTPVIEAVFPTFFIVSWSSPRPVSVGGGNSSAGSSADKQLQQQKGVGGVNGWFYQVSWLSYGEASSVPTNITTPLQHVVIPREFNESRFALQVVCVPRLAASAAPSANPSPARPGGGGGGSTTAAAPQFQASATTVLSKIIWSRTIDLTLDGDALSVGITPQSLIAAPPAASDAAMVSLRGPATGGGGGPFSFRTAADILSSPAMLDLYLLSCASPIGCLSSLPDVLSMMMYLGTKPLHDPLHGAVADTGALLMASMGVGDEEREARRARRTAKAQRRHRHRPVLLGQGVLKGINFMGVRCTVPITDNNNTNNAAPASSKHHRHLHYMVCLDDLHSSQQASNSGAAAMILRDVFNNATENSSSEDDGEEESEADRLAREERRRLRREQQQMGSSTTASPALSPRFGANRGGAGGSATRHKPTNVLKLANLWELLEKDDDAAIIFTGQRSKSAHMCAQSLLGSLANQAAIAAANDAARAKQSEKALSTAAVAPPTASAPAAAATIASVEQRASSRTLSVPPISTAAAVAAGNAFSSTNAPLSPVRTPFADASEAVVVAACKRIYSVVFDGPLEDFFSRQNTVMKGTAKYAAQFISLSTASAGMTEEDRNLVAFTATAAGLSAGPTGLSVALATTASTGAGALLSNTNQFVPTVPEGGAIIGPSPFANGQLSALNTITQFGADGNSFLGTHATTPANQQNALRVARDDGLPPNSLGGPNALPATMFISAPVGLHACLESCTTETATTQHRTSRAPSADGCVDDAPPAAAAASSFGVKAVTIPASAKAQGYGGALSALLYQTPDVAMHPLGVATHTTMASCGAIGTLSLYNESALVDVTSAALGLPVEEAMALLGPSITSIEAAVHDAVFVHITIRGNCLGLRPLLTVQCDAPIPSPPIEPRIIVASTHCIVAEFRLEKVYPFLPCVPSCSLSVLLSTSFGVQGAGGVELVLPGEYLDFLAPALSVGSSERAWATTSTISELIAGAITAEPFFCTLADRDLSSGITHKQLTTIESVVEIINETSSKNNGLFSRLTNAASRVTGKRQISLATSSKNEQVSRILSDHIRIGRDTKMLASQLSPWRTKVQLVFPWAAKAQLYEQKVRLFYAIFAEMEQSSVALASNDGVKGGGGYGDVTKAQIGADVSEQSGSAGYLGPKDVALFSNMPNLAGTNFVEPSLSGAGSAAANLAAQTGAATSSNFNTIASSGGRPLPTVFMEMMINTEVLRVCRRANADLYTQSVTFEQGFRPVLPTPNKFAIGDALSNLMTFEEFYGLMFPIFNAHRVFNDVSSEALLADIATLWCIVAIHHLRMAYLLSKHIVIVGPSKSGSTTLCNLAKQVRGGILGRSYFRNGGGGRISREEIQQVDKVLQSRGGVVAAGGSGSSSPASLQLMLSQLREQTVNIKEMKRLEELSAPIAQGINTTIVIVGEKNDIASDSFHTAFIKPLRSRVAAVAGGGGGSALSSPTSPPSARGGGGSGRGMFSRAVVVLTKMDEALKLYVEEVLAKNGGGAAGTRRASKPPTASTNPSAAATSASASFLPLSKGYLMSKATPSSANYARYNSVSRVWAEGLVADLFTYIEGLLKGDSVISAWRSTADGGGGALLDGTAAGAMANTVFKVWLTTNNRSHVEKAVSLMVELQLVPQGIIEDAASSVNAPSSDVGAVVTGLSGHVISVLIDVSTEQMKRLVS